MNLNDSDRVECVRLHLVSRLVGGEPGTELAVAEVGLLCRACFNRLAWRLAEVPELVSHVRSMLIPGGSGNEAPVSGSREIPVPLDLDALEGADSLWAQIANWGTYWARVLGVRPPDVLQAALSADREVEGLAVADSSSDAWRSADEVVRWLRGFLESIAYLGAVAEFHDDVVDLVSGVKRRWPMDAPRVLEARPRLCEVCLARRVLVSWESELPVIRCGACGHGLEVDWSDFGVVVSGSSEKGAGVVSDAAALAVAGDGRG